MTLSPRFLALAQDLPPVHLVSCKHRTSILFLIIVSAISLLFPVSVQMLRVAIFILQSLFLSLYLLSRPSRILLTVSRPWFHCASLVWYGLAWSGTLWNSGIISIDVAYFYEPDVLLLLSESKPARIVLACTTPYHVNPQYDFVKCILTNLLMRTKLFLVCTINTYGIKYIATCTDFADLIVVLNFCWSAIE